MLTSQKVLLHASDWHLACKRPPWSKLAGRRLIGYLRWKLLRGKTHDPSLIEAFSEKAKAIRPDQIILTGDLTHLGLPEEFELALSFLRLLGPPALVSLVPGNHDSYAPEPWDETYAKWSSYLGGQESLEELFPRVKILGQLALIGLSTACPNVPPFAIGRLGLKQLERLAKVLEDLRQRGYFRVVYLHHPPLPGVVSKRKALRDLSSLQRILVKEGAELILYGHTHRKGFYLMDTLWGKVPVYGVSALTYTGKKEEKRARFYLFKINESEKTFTFQSFGWDGKNFSLE